MNSLQQPIYRLIRISSNYSNKRISLSLYKIKNTVLSFKTTVLDFLQGSLKEMSPKTCIVNMNQRRCNYFLHQINSTVVIFLEYFFANFETFIIMLVNHHNYRIHDRIILFRRALDQ